MGRSSDRTYIPGKGQVLEIGRPKPNFPVYNTIALRRIKFTKAFALLIACSVFLSVTVSFVITTIIAKNVEVLAARVHPSKLPFHGLLAVDTPMTAGSEPGISLPRSVRWPGNTYSVEWAEVESTVGKLHLLGAGYDLPQDTIQLLFPVATDSGKPGIAAWSPDNPSLKLKWSNVILPATGEGYPALYGWALVNSELLNALPNRRPGILLELAEHYRFDPENPTSTPSINRYFQDIEKYAPPGTKVITPYSGTMSLKRATRGAFSSWQFISLLVLLSAAAAITCVFTVSFLGRKRSLGIFRVLGATVADLRRSMALEAVYIGLPGIVLGIFVGRYLAAWLETGQTLPVSAYITAVITGMLTIAAGVWMPLQLIRNANCDQLLNNRPVYVISNPSCANCGLCGGI